MVLMTSCFLLALFQDGAMTQAGYEAGVALTKAAIAATGLSHERTTSGLSFKLVFNHPENRAQTVYVSSQPNDIGGLKTNLIYTTV